MIRPNKFGRRNRKTGDVNLETRSIMYSSETRGRDFNRSLFFPLRWRKNAPLPTDVVKQLESLTSDRKENSTEVRKEANVRAIKGRQMAFTRSGENTPCLHNPVRRFKQDHSVSLNNLSVTVQNCITNISFKNTHGHCFYNAHTLCPLLFQSLHISVKTSSSEKNVFKRR